MHDDTALHARIRDALVYSFPVHDVAQTRWQFTQNPDNHSQRGAPPNVLHHNRRLLNHRARTVTMPNNDTLYSIAGWTCRAGRCCCRCRICRTATTASPSSTSSPTTPPASAGAPPARPPPPSCWPAPAGGEAPAGTRLLRLPSNDIWALAACWSTARKTCPPCMRCRTPCASRRSTPAARQAAAGAARRALARALHGTGQRGDGPQPRARARAGAGGGLRRPRPAPRRAQRGRRWTRRCRAGPRPTPPTCTPCARRRPTPPIAAGAAAAGRPGSTTGQLRRRLCLPGLRLPGRAGALEREEAIYFTALTDGRAKPSTAPTATGWPFPPTCRWTPSGH